MHDNNMGNKALEREKKRRLWVVENGVQRHLFFSFFFLMVEIFTQNFVCCCCKNTRRERREKNKGAPREGHGRTDGALFAGFLTTTRETVDEIARARAFARRAFVRSVLLFFPARLFADDDYQKNCMTTTQLQKKFSFERVT